MPAWPKMRRAGIILLLVLLLVGVCWSSNANEEHELLRRVDRVCSRRDASPIVAANIANAEVHMLFDSDYDGRCWFLPHEIYVTQKGDAVRAIFRALSMDPERYGFGEARGVIVMDGNVPIIAIDNQSPLRDTYYSHYVYIMADKVFDAESTPSDVPTHSIAAVNLFMGGGVCALTALVACLLFVCKRT